MDARTNTKPNFPWQLPLLGSIAALGLYAMFRAGEAAFSLLERGHTYSLTMALFIEAASVAVALEIALSYKETLIGGGDWSNSEPEKIKREVNWPAVIVEAVTLTCSAIFNFTWVSKVLVDESFIQIAAYSVGPLVALSGIGMTTGNVLRKWLTEMTEWKLEMSSQAQAVDADTAAYRRELAATKLQAELDRQAATQSAEIKERTRAAKAQERIDRQRVKAEAVQVVQAHVATGPGPVLVPGVPVLDRAKAILEGEPGISGSELGRRLEVSPGWGRKLKRQAGTNGKKHV